MTDRAALNQPRLQDSQKSSGSSAMAAVNAALITSRVYSTLMPTTSRRRSPTARTGTPYRGPTAGYLIRQP